MPTILIPTNIIAFPYPRFAIEDYLVSAAALISINSPTPKEWEPPLPYEKFTDVLKLDFDDIPCSKLTREGVDYIGPEMHHVKSALKFASDIKAKGGAFIAVHCTAGKSRSAAIALGILYDHLGAGSEELAVKTLLLHDKDQQMCFNPRIISLLDELLNGSRKLEAALVKSCPPFVSWKKYWDRLT